MPTLLVTGANRGLGQGFARHYAEAGWDVIAAGRRPPADGGGLRWEALDLADEASIAALAKRLGDVSLDLLINNAGAGWPWPLQVGQSRQADWLSVLAVNTVGPFLLAERLAPCLARGTRPAVVNISSGLGSVTAGETEGGVYYSVSKAALNMATRHLATVLRPLGIIALALSPGWVRTDMGGAAADLSVEESVGGMTRVIAGLTAGDSGRFLNWRGDAVAW